MSRRYTACGGLFNQHYSHVSALTLAVKLGADVIIPHAVQRQSFDQYFNQDPTKNQVLWTSAPFSSLYDTEKLMELLSGDSHM